MPVSPKIEACDFYLNMPSLEHETGDIWHNLPGFGYSRNATTTGIVISPACDLSQKKTETVTIVPIIFIDDYLYSKSFYSEIWNELYNKLKPYGADDYLPPDRFSHPPIPFLDKVLQELEAAGKGGEDLKARIFAYKEYIVYTQKPAEVRLGKKPEINKILSDKKYNEILKKILKNSFKSDMHFFPAHKVSAGFEPIPFHSVALFRYVYSFPLEILDAAQSSREEWWSGDCERMSGSTPLVEQFKKYPIKVSRLKDDFLSDLISRYLSMFLRLGSRDFTDSSINNFVSEIKGA